MLKNKKQRGKHAAPSPSESVSVDVEESPDESSSGFSDALSSAALNASSTMKPPASNASSTVKSSSSDAPSSVASGESASEITRESVSVDAMRAIDSLFSEPAGSGGLLAAPITSSASAAPASFGTAAINIPPEKQKKNLKPLWIALGAFFGVLILLYLAGVFFFMEKFWPNTRIGTTDISFMTVDEAATKISERAGEYTLEVKGQGLSFSMTAQAGELLLDERRALEQALSNNNSWMWPVEVPFSHDESDSLTDASYEESPFGNFVREQVEAHNQVADASIDATIAFNEEIETFEITPEDIGTQLDYGEVMAKVDRAIISLAPEARITEEELIQPLVLAEDENLEVACDEANKMIAADLELMMGGNLIGEVDASVISRWVELTPEVTVRFKEDDMRAWATELAAKCNTVGTTRIYKRPDGKEVTVHGGTYGWEIDGGWLADAIAQGVLAGEVATLDIPTLVEGKGFTELGGQDWGKRYVDIDLDEQHARFYNENGEIIWESDIVSGVPGAGRETPSGVYVVNNMASPATLVGEPLPGQTDPEYRTKVTYWMPFVGNAVGLHDATWQYAFGGERYQIGYGSHGCVNLPYDKAQEIYGLLEIGDVVITHKEDQVVDEG